VTGSEIDGAIEFAAHDFESDCGRGREGFAEQRSNSVVLQDVYGELGKLLGVETRVVTHEDGRLFRLGFHVFGDSRHGQTHVGEGKIVGDESAPSGSAKLNRRGRHGAVF